MQNEATAALEALQTTVAEMLPTGCSGSGEPTSRKVKIIGGEHVTAWHFHFTGKTVFELRYRTGTKPLSIIEAAEVVEG